MKNRGHTSKWFPVRQGTRQGGKSSPNCYLLYINGLINALEHSGLGFCVYGMNINSPTVADDMILIAFSKHALDGMMKICYDYSCKWRFFATECPNTFRSTASLFVEYYNCTL